MPPSVDGALEIAGTVSELEDIRDALSDDGIDLLEPFSDIDAFLSNDATSDDERTMKELWHGVNAVMKGTEGMDAVASMWLLRAVDRVHVLHASRLLNEDFYRAFPMVFGDILERARGMVRMAEEELPS